MSLVPCFVGVHIKTILKRFPLTGCTWLLSQTCHLNIWCGSLVSYSCMYGATGRDQGKRDDGEYQLKL